MGVGITALGTATASRGTYYITIFALMAEAKTTILTHLAWFIWSQGLDMTWLLLI